MERRAWPGRDRIGSRCPIPSLTNRGATRSSRESFVSRTKVRVTETWDCGQPLTARMEYTATGFSSPIRFFFRSVLMSRKEMYLEPITPENRWITRKRMEWGVASLWETALYFPVARAILFAASWVKRLQSGAIQLYLLFVFVALVLAIIVAL